MTRDQAVSLAIIAAALVGTPLLIWIGLARDTLRHADARCGLDADRTPSPAEIADAIAIRDREESWDRLTYGDADWQAWEQEVRR